MAPDQFLVVFANIVTTFFGYSAVSNEVKKLRHEVERMERESAEAVIVLRERIATVEMNARAHR
jgi:hypothetical protein